MNIYTKNMNPDKKLTLALQLYHSAKALKTASLKQFHPELTENEIREKVKKIFFYART